MTNKETFATTYAQAFVESYPTIPAEMARPMIEKSIKVALENIRGVIIDGTAFRTTCERLGIECTHKDIEEYINHA